MRQTKITQANRHNSDHWNPSFIHRNPLFWPISPAYAELNVKQHIWPSLEDYNQCLGKCTNKNGKNISFVTQNLHFDTFEDEYEPRIYRSGQVQTRENNWHDFFQVMVWKTFPKTKSLLNKVHYDAAIKRHKDNIKKRGNQENFVTLFDECGAIVLSSSKGYLDMVKNFKWRAFFVENKSKFGKAIDCAVFGHAMYEKALTPYIGMTAHCLLLLVDETYFTFNVKQKNNYIDTLLSDHINSIKDLNTKCLTPLPLLGIPGWHPDQSHLFYENQSYFRTGRRKNNNQNMC